MAAPHQSFRTGHGRCLGQEPFGDRLAYRQQSLPPLAGVALGADPGQHLIGAFVAPAAPQGEQLTLIEVAAEAPGRIPPGAGVERLGVEQQTIEVEEAGGRRGHRSSMAGR